jgi:NADH pyrophosphatase NudC (nudix superfamily)
VADYRFCPQCASPLAPREQLEDGGPKTRLRCSACDFTHWNNPTPVLAAVIECSDREGRVFLARNAAWTRRMFALVTGFLEAGESPLDGVRREVMEETSLEVESATIIGAYEFLRMNQVIVAYHVVARGEIRLSPELAEYKLMRPEDAICWPAGTGYALADWLRSRGHVPRFFDAWPRDEVPGPKPAA